MRFWPELSTAQKEKRKRRRRRDCIPSIEDVICMKYDIPPGNKVLSVKYMFFPGMKI